jgi:branched-chain amino acid transport system permease protein
MEYLLHILIMIGIYSILAMSLNLPAGFTGLISVAHAAFYGIGAYTTALLSRNAGVPFWLCLPAGVLLTALIAFLIAWPSLRTRDDYFVITTFAFQIIVFSILNNWVSFTGGPMGIPGIPQPQFLDITLSSHGTFLCLVAVIGIAVYLFLNRLVNSPYGTVLKAIREDEILVQSLGKNVTHYKMAAFVIGAAIASIGGGLYAMYISYIDPTNFTVMESVFILSIVIIGGVGSLKGSVVGATILVALPEILRFVGLPNAIAANMRQILYGTLLVLCMMYRPQGLFGEYAFNAHPPKRKGDDDA